MRIQVSENLFLISPPLFALSLRMLYFQGHLGVEPYGTLIISAAM